MVPSHSEALGRLLRLSKSSCPLPKSLKKRRLSHSANQKRNNFEARAERFPRTPPLAPVCSCAISCLKILTWQLQPSCTSSSASLSTFTYLCFSSRASPARMFVHEALTRPFSDRQPQGSVDGARPWSRDCALLYLGRIAFEAPAGRTRTSML